MYRDTKTDLKHLKRMNCPSHSSRIRECNGMLVELQHNGTEVPADWLSGVAPCVGKPGWFFDRKKRRAWVENTAGVAWETRVEDWLFRFEIAHLRELSRSDLAALKHLENFGLLSAKQKRLVHVHGSRTFLCSVKRSRIARRLKARGDTQS